MYSHSLSENGNVNSRCLYCFMTIASDVESEAELTHVETRHICPEKALARLLALERTALVQIPIAHK